MLETANDVKKTYDSLLSSGFPEEKLLSLIESRVLEDVLWPHYNSSSDQPWSLLIVWLLRTKRLSARETLTSLELDQGKLTTLIRFTLRSSLDSGLSFKVRSACLSVVIDAFSQLDVLEIQRACQPIVSILSWQLLVPQHRDSLFAAHPNLKKRYRARLKFLHNATEEERQTICLEKDYIYHLAVELIKLLNIQRNESESIFYCCKILELFSDLLGQLPTRRYLVSLFQDLQICTASRLSYRLANGHALSLYDANLKSAVLLFEHFLFAPYNDFEGRELTLREIRDQRAQKITRLQHLAFTEYKDSLSLLALSHQGTISSRSELGLHLEDLDDAALLKLCETLGFRTKYEFLETDIAQFLRQALIDEYATKATPKERLQSSRVLATEVDLASSEQNCLLGLMCDPIIPLPKLTLQYLSIDDFLHRTFLLYQALAWQSLRKDIVTALERLSPYKEYPSGNLSFNGSSMNAMSIDAPAIVEVTPPKIISHGCPSIVRAEVKLDLGQNDKSWQKLRPGDYVFFLHVAASDETTNGLAACDDPEFLHKAGVRSVRTAVIESVLSIDGKPIFEAASSYDSANSLGRTLRVLFDSRTFQHDKESEKLEEVYENLNLLIKRSPEKNQIFTLLQTLQDYEYKANDILPEWLNDAILGFGHSVNPVKTVSLYLGDTFLDAQHALECFPQIEMESTELEPQDGSNSDAYHGLTNAKLKGILTTRKLSTSGNKPELLARLKEDDASHRAQRSTTDVGQFESVACTLSIKELNETRKDQPEEHVRQLTWHKLPSRGPYPTDRPKRNATRFSASQVKAIRNAAACGLTLVDGPAGSGKSLVVSQILQNIYHSTDKNERFLMLCNSDINAAALYDRLRTMNFDELHLLPLISGTASPQLSIIKSKKSLLLGEVTRLAESMKIEGDHGVTCETAAYFFATVVEPILKQSRDISPQSTTFAFEGFFSNVSANYRQDHGEFVISCNKYIELLFLQLAEYRPLELLKSPERQEEYLLTKGARIVIMSANHAALARPYYAKLELDFDNVIIEQASSLTELESLNPFMLLRDPSSVKRFVLTGDSMQMESRNVSHPAIALHCMANQSLFRRLLRTGCPAVTLDRQGRSRASIADVYRHRYSELSDLPLISNEPYTQANSGLLFTSQFVDVAEYKRQGEFSPRSDTWQNLGEAEYVVALYQYMRLLNYPADKIAILTPFSGQKALIGDVLNARCRRVSIFGMPKLLTVSESHSQEFDYVLVSLVRTSSCAELRDARMLTTALSRARLGLYVFGRSAALPRSVMRFFEPLKRAPHDKLQLVTGEMYGSASRTEGEGSEKAATMENVEHLGKFVYQMTETRLAHSDA